MKRHEPPTSTSFQSPPGPPPMLLAMMRSRLAKPAGGARGPAEVLLPAASPHVPASLAAAAAATCRRAVWRCWGAPGLAAAKPTACRAFVGRDQHQKNARGGQERRCRSGPAPGATRLTTSEAGQHPGTDRLDMPGSRRRQGQPRERQRGHVAG